VRIGIFGGTFNPIHYGHLRAAEEVRERLGLARVLFVPSGMPPLKSRDLAAAPMRYEMVRRAVSRNRFFTALDIECARPGKSFTVRTLETLADAYAGSELFFLLGIDAFLDIPNWREPERLITLVNFAVVSRPSGGFADLVASPYLKIARRQAADLEHGKTDVLTVAVGESTVAELIRITPLEISSTDIRERIKRGDSIKYLLPEAVESFIISNNLYR
jgi:nicotinate-nucleotide adenylyltransferase